MPIEYAAHFAPLSPSLIAEIAALGEEIFEPPPIDYAWRLTRMPEVSAFWARYEGRLVGFKLGYAMAERRYYSWLGAVHPEFRRQGIATRLARLQHEWLARQGYAAVETSSREDNAAMAEVNQRCGFATIGRKFASHGAQVLWERRLGET